MKRRDFVASLPVLGAATTTMAKNGKTPRSANKFKMNFAPHGGMFKNLAGDSILDQLLFMADQGFTAFEDNGMKNRSIQEQEDMAKLMSQLGIKMGVFVAHTISWKEPNLAKGDQESRDQFLQEIRESVEVAKRVNATWMTVVPGHQDLRQTMGYQTAHVVESLRRAAEILEPHGLVMVLEPLNFFNHPGLFLTGSAQAFEICRAVDSPACKILFDIYHQQIQEGNLIPNIDHSWDEIAYFQIGDNPGRKEPGTGEINFKNVFSHIHSKGFEGILGMEHGNSKEGKTGEEAVIDAYRLVDIA